MAPTSAWKGAGSNQFLEENKLVATFCWLGSINQSFLGWGVFLKDILSGECWSLATVCVHCAELVKLFPSVISLFPKRNFPAALGSWAFQSHPCCQVWLFPLDVHLLADWKSYSHRNRKIAAVLSALPFWRGCLSRSSREILAPTGTWDIFVISPSFLTSIFLFFVKTETWRCLIPLATFLSTVGREVWGYLRIDQKWNKKKSLPWNWVRPTLGLPKNKSLHLTPS